MFVNRVQLRFTCCTALAVLMACAAMSCGGCSSKGPTLEGAGGLIGPKRVRVGEQFEVIQPFDKDRGAQWRLVHFDSKIIGLVPFEPVRTNSKGEMQRIMRFEARSSGESELQFARRQNQPWVPGEALPEPEKRVLRIRVTD